MRGYPSYFESSSVKVMEILGTDFFLGSSSLVENYL